MANLAAEYLQHIQQLQERTASVLAREGLDGLIIHSGQVKRQFLDDLDYPFKVNPHFKAWLPVVDNPNCWLVVDGVHKPKLIYCQAEGFWHQSVQIQPDYWNDSFDITLFSHPDQVFKYLPKDMANMAYIGEHTEVYQALGIGQFNPEAVLNYLHYQRAQKTEYEISCISEANRIAVAGHKAAQQAFLNAGSELDIHLAYLQATRHSEAQVPYENIVALNQHAAVLHYAEKAVQPPSSHNSLLIDAGASFAGYASDITRTYSQSAQGLYPTLVQGVEALQLEIIQRIKPGVSYVELHQQTHLMLAALLQETGLVNLAPELQLQSGVSRVFFPHGLGHFIGLQVHDVGGHMADARGTQLPQTAGHPFLRLTRKLEKQQVVTVEPGLYFIPSLLQSLQQSEHAKHINWSALQQLLPFGGIRIEDNLLVVANGCRNLTREVW